MQRITISDQFVKDKCMLSGKEGDVVHVEFQDGAIKGPVSLRHLSKLIKTRGENGNGQAPLFEGQQQQ